MWHLDFSVFAHVYVFALPRAPLRRAALPAFPGAPGAALVPCGGALRNSMALLHAILMG